MIAQALALVISAVFDLVILAALVRFWMQALLLYVVLGASPFEFPAVFPVLVFQAFVTLVRLSIYVFMGAIIIQAVLSWVAPHHPVAPFFDALTRPFLRPVQRAVPLIGGVDISPLFVFIFFQLLLMLPVAWFEQEGARMVQRALL